MKKLVLNPNGWPCTLDECPTGLFVFNHSVCMKTEYKTNNSELEAFNEAGEFFWGGTESCVAREKLIVQPVIAEWIEEDE